MKRLTKTYSDGSFGVADDLPCGENNNELNQRIINRLGNYEESDVNDANMIFQLTCDTEEFTKFLAVNGSGRFDYSCKLLDDMNEEEQEILKMSAQVIAEAFKSAFIRRLENKEKLND